MGKKLSEMTLKELWHLFPIQLTAHQEGWAAQYEEMEQELSALLAGRDVRISHIGSTAIRGIWAKPIVDVLIEADEGEDLREIAGLLRKNNFIQMSAEENRISLNRGYTEEGFAEKVYHLHLRHMGDNDEAYFRDYLNEFPDIAKEYEALKLNLWKQYEFNRDGYTEAKTDFIRFHTGTAKKRYMK